MWILWIAIQIFEVYIYEDIIVAMVAVTVFTAASWCFWILMGILSEAIADDLERIAKCHDELHK